MEKLLFGGIAILSGLNTMIVRTDYNCMLFLFIFNTWERFKAGLIAQLVFDNDYQDLREALSFEGLTNNIQHLFFLKSEQEELPLNQTNNDLLQEQLDIQYQNIKSQNYQLPEQGYRISQRNNINLN
ncbi:hypothetical protein PPERSA_04394 [Pseudocohnilembus persalinus]|uniref:Uncharacterized protein n=1 Tax=Pseudocohnilembus persalinus TaxID=266149 RepID=A0A0V0QQM2_PSEPJ|nr:hypothetical protein PPERSA_04394 [Pseudocohnilembus persalinus]|eukprot:KRX04579.1 hypothetical protein PPERSA_04394 [Pseudocohnilembus persalinus]